MQLGQPQAKVTEVYVHVWYFINNNLKLFNFSSDDILKTADVHRF